MRWKVVGDHNVIESPEQIRMAPVTPGLTWIERIGIRLMRAWNALFLPVEVMPKVRPWQTSDGSELKGR